MPFNNSREIKNKRREFSSLEDHQWVEDHVQQILDSAQQIAHPGIHLQSLGNVHRRQFPVLAVDAADRE